MITKWSAGPGGDPMDNLQYASWISNFDTSVGQTPELPSVVVPGNVTALTHCTYALVPVSSLWISLYYVSLV